MTTGATGQLGLALPVQGELSGTWGDTVNNGITQYTNIAIAGTLTLTGDGAVTLANTTGDASASNITSTLSGAGTVTAQFAIVRVSGTTTTKVITGPSYSKTYVVDNASSYAVTFKASGQTGVSVAAAEKVTVVFNGTDYIKIAGTIANAAGSNTQIQFNNGGLFGASANLTWDGTTLSSTQINITGQGTLRLQDTTGGEYVGLRAPASLGASYTLTWPADDGTSGQALITDGSGVLSWSTAASGDVYGPASSTDNAVARFDGTTGKLIQDSVVLIGDTGAVTGVTDLTASGAVTISGGTANGVTYLNGSKVLTSGSALTFDGTNLGVGVSTPQGRIHSQVATPSTSAVSTPIYYGGDGTKQFQLLQTGATYNTAGAGGNELWYYTASYAALTFGSDGNIPIKWVSNGSEQMRLTSTGLGIGTSSPLTKLNTYQTGGGALATFGTNTSLAYIIVGGQSTTAYHTRFGYDVTNEYGYIQSIAAAGVYDDIAINPLGGNVGIGTSSPAAKLHVSSASDDILRLTATAPYLSFYNGATRTGYIRANTSGTFGIVSEDASTPMSFYTAGAEVMRLSTTGNLGLGVTPSASNTVKALEIGQVGNYFAGLSGDSGIYLASNAYYNSGWKYAVSSKPATLYSSSAGSHGWHIAGSGTAGNTFSFTQAMTLDASGNLGVGTTSPALRIHGAVAGTAGARIENTASTGAAYWQAKNTGTSCNFGVDANGGYIETLGAYSTLFYTNGSERMRLDSAGNLGLGVTPSAWRSNYKAIQAGNGASFSGANSSNTAWMGSNWYVNSSNVDTYIGTGQATVYAQGSGQHLWYTSASGTAGNAISFTQAMTLDASGNLGVGVTSMNYPLTVAGASNGNTITAINNSSNISRFCFAQYGTPSNTYTNIEGDARSTGYLAFRTNDTERARIDSSGNLGLGVTPSAWGNGKAIQVAGSSAAAALYQNSSGTLYLGNNYAFTSADKYVANGYATRYGQYSGQHVWETAGNNTSGAGAALSFSTAMTLDASGNLGVGTTSPSERLDVRGSDPVALVKATNTSGSATLNLQGLASNGSDVAVSQLKSVSEGASPASSMTFSTRNSVGTTAERARIDSSGNMLFQTTNASDSAGVGGKYIVNATVPYFATVGSGTSNTNAGYTLYSTGAAAYRFYVGYGGTVYATSTTITAISDQRLKENIRDLDEGLATVMALKPRKFDWKEGKGQNIKNARGFIAQEFETVLPDMIEEWRDPAPEGEEAYKAINANLIPTLVKAIQELKASMDAVKAEFDAYKASHP